jgi:hypothetical protein
VASPLRHTSPGILVAAIGIPLADIVRRLLWWTIESTVDGIEGTIDGIESTVDGIEGTIDGIESTVDGIESTVESTVWVCRSRLSPNLRADATDRPIP